MIKIRYHFKSGSTIELGNPDFERGQFREWAKVNIFSPEALPDVVVCNSVMNSDTWINMNEVEWVEEILS